MNNDTNSTGHIGAILHFDKRSKEAIAEKKALGNENSWLDLMQELEFFNGEAMMPIEDILLKVSQMNKTKTQKVFILESVGFDFSQVFIILGFSF